MGFIIWSSKTESRQNIHPPSGLCAGRSYQTTTQSKRLFHSNKIPKNTGQRIGCINIVRGYRAFPFHKKNVNKESTGLKMWRCSVVGDSLVIFRHSVRLVLNKVSSVFTRFVVQIRIRLLRCSTHVIFTP